ncbi:hypothetical protein RM844_13815 [Streptomyces sp. DSM 44915]|uniref:GNAT family N-acetyltransferase n=1 Tax=Streptomyces chisholmiae TaxID=3075540 RepID=A0ABU2JQV4_9ACTN|nr:hypothetical protein [Streptomyces sp. DSM 44915]MDT0267363.1 hypothetical protein [Streptomyces sp. DSM 44915]
MRLRGYRDRDAELLSGPWPPGELLGLPLPNWPALAPFTSVPPPSGEGDEELCVAGDAAFVRYTDIDWVRRRARLEIGVRHPVPEGLDALLAAAVAHGLRRLNLHRLHGWVTPLVAPADGGLAGTLSKAGLVREATVPEHLWLAGRAVDREIWGVVRDD